MDAPRTPGQHPGPQDDPNSERTTQNSELVAPAAGEWHLQPVYPDSETTGPCPNCGEPMHAIRGSKQAVCQNCGFKDSCCF